MSAPIVLTMRTELFGNKGVGVEERRLAERLKRRRKSNDAEDAQLADELAPTDDAAPLVPADTVQSQADGPTASMAYGHDDWTVAVDTDRPSVPGRRRAARAASRAPKAEREETTSPARPQIERRPGERQTGGLRSRLDAVREAEPVSQRRPAPRRDGPVIAPMDPAAAEAAPANGRPRRPVHPPRTATAVKSERESTARQSGAKRKPAPGEITGGGTVVIDGDLYPLTDWSPDAIGIPSPRHFYKMGDRRVLELELDFTDYAVNLDLNAVVVERADGRTEWLVEKPTRRQRELLASLSAAAARGGDPFPSDGVSSKAARASRRARNRRLRRWMPLANLASLPLNAVIIALMVIIGALTDRSALPLAATVEPVFQPVSAVDAAVAVPVMRVLSPAHGTLLSIDVAAGELIQRGAVLLQLRTIEDDRERVSVLSPCDCVVAELLVRDGLPLREGQLLAMLYDQDAEPTIHAFFAPGDVPAVGEKANVRPAGVPTPVMAAVTGLAPDTSGVLGVADRVRALAGDAVLVELTPEKGLPATLAGVPAFVETASE
ncbi:MAG: hypothetical protein AAF580_12275 [Pseudomonadota bacterium]